MKSHVSTKNAVAPLLLGVWLAGSALAAAEVPRDAIERLRSDLKADRNSVIAQEMSFTPKESEAFWPVYRSYRAETERVADRIVELVLEYEDLFPDVPEQKATEMLKAYTKAEGDLLNIKRKYLKKFGKVLPASKVFRFAQLDNRFDLGTRLALAASLPALPVGQGQAPSEGR